MKGVASVIFLALSAQAGSQVLIYDSYKHFVYRTEATEVAISSDGRFLAYGVENCGEVTILDLKVNKRLHLLNEGSKQTITDLEFDHSNQYVIASFKDKAVIIWDLISGREEKKIESYDGQIEEIELNRNNNLLAIAGSLPDIELYHFPSGDLKGKLKGGNSKSIRIAYFNYSGDQLVSIAEDQQLAFWNCSDMRLVRKFEVSPSTMDGSGTKISAADVGESGDLIAVAFEETLLDKGGSKMIFRHNIALYDWQTGAQVKIIEGNVKKMEKLQLSPGNGYVLADNSTFSENRLSFWNRNTGTYSEKQLLPGEIRCFALSQDGATMAISYVDKSNKDGSYVAVYSVSGLEQKQTAALNKGFTAVGTADMMNQSMYAADQSPKAFEGELTTGGKYYALIMGVNEYDDENINDLDEALKDAGNLYEILTKSYTFNPENVTYLQNPKNADIIIALDHYEKVITPADNFLIFYAGHGYWDERTQKGYWLPSDASRENTVNWFRNSTLTGYISGIKSRHTLVIADACFSGSIFKTRDAFGNMDMGVERLYKLPSRKAMTSGTLKEVPDKSVFLEYLSKRLVENGENYLSAEQLFFSFKTAVLNNSQTIPQFGEISNAGDEGGDFIFIRKDAK